MMIMMKHLLQDVVYALAHATGKTGRFTLIERWRNNERLLAPQEHPLKVSYFICDS
jgi:Ras association domain-containing protein 7/8